MSWMIYGANGYSGELIAREAVARGLAPVLAGRNEAAVTTLAQELNLEARVFALAPIPSSELDGIRLVLNCAGPFSATAAPMMDACIASACHYLDITGEIAIFERAQTLRESAREAGIVLCPGVGFDVIPTDCVAAALHARLPDATHLALGFDSRSGLSQGTAKTSVEGLAQGGCVRREGRLERVPLAWRTRTIDFGDGEKLAMTIPWGDVATAFYTTGIPNIEAYIPASPRLVARLRKLNWIRPLLGLGPVQGFLKGQVERRVRGPDREQRRRHDTYVWGEVKNSRETVTARLRTANGYEVTVDGSLGLVQHTLDTEIEGGAYTPSQLVGPDFAASLRGSGPMQIG